MSVVPQPAPPLPHPPAPLERGRGVRVDGELKVSGQMLYSDDLALEGLLHVAVLRSPHPHARIAAIDSSAAARVPGVRLVLTGADVASLRFGRAVRDVPILAADKVRFVGEMVAAVAADSRDSAEEAVALLDVTYEPLPAVFDPVEALRPGAPAVHDAPTSYAGAARGPDEPPNLVGRAAAAQGDVEAALASADRVFERTFRTQAHHQGYLEPHSCTVLMTTDGQVHIWSCNKSPYKLREQLSAAFDLPEEQITLHSPAIGGDFGGKGSPMDVPLCLELSRRTGRPVRMTMRYSEELQGAGPRHASVTRVRVGVSHDGRLQALDVHATFNAGAYAGFRPAANFTARAATSYRLPAVRVVAERVYTNQVPGGNARAPGAPQLTFAVESMLDHVARELGIEPATFRRNNVLRDGEANPFGERWLEVRALQTLDAAERAYRPAFPHDTPPTVRFGRGIAIYDRPTHPAQRTSIRLRLQPDGTVEAQVPQMETGTGSHTILRRVIAEGIGVERTAVVIRYVGTAHLPYDSGVGGSRVTISASEAAHAGALAFRERLLAAAGRHLGVAPAEVTLGTDGAALHRPSGRTLSLAALAAAGEPIEVVGEVEPDAHGGHHEAATSYCVQIAQVGVDVETGQVVLYHLLTAHDVADVLDPLTHQSQIEGGAVMGIGYALHEDLGLQDGQVAAAHLGDYKLPSIADLAPLEVVLVPGGKGMGARNVKGIGELPNVPTAAAIANAVADAVGARVDSLPITAEKVLQALRQR
ncbi:MAG TPA: xanthine dehydrogenase family protein molybdopterin-binding subunit [Chloroflexota bacterium]|nr:xanthine dehydrogenase family protein molybdopterin-binding subunit [Chloroflexota bacterium]